MKFLSTILLIAVILCAFYGALELHGFIYEAIEASDDFDMAVSAFPSIVILAGFLWLCAWIHSEYIATI